MNRFSFCMILCAALLALMAGCSDGGKSDGNKASPLKLEHIFKSDSISFKQGTSRVCKVNSSLTTDYPIWYINDTLTRRLQQIYMAQVLEMPADTAADIPQVMAQVARAMLSKFGDSGDEIEYGLATDDDDRQVLEYVVTAKITVAHCDSSVITFCRHENISKQGQTTTDAHHYTSFNAQTLERIDIYDLFDDEALPYVAQLLKSELLRQSQVKTEDELIALGFFNLDNITVNNNFYFDAEGVTWNFLTYEIACYSVGETQVKLGYESLAPYVGQQSLINAYLK